MCVIKLCKDGIIITHLEKGKDQITETGVISFWTTDDQ